MISIFPIDYMHITCSLLGICRKLIKLWLTGCPETGCKKNSEFRLSSRHKNIINDRINKLRKSIPKEFNRKPRELNEFDRWKSTELRLFVLYTGQFLMKNILTTKYYNYFLLFNTALSLLVSGNLVKKKV